MKEFKTPTQPKSCCCAQGNLITTVIEVEELKNGAPMPMLYTHSDGQPPCISSVTVYFVRTTAC